MIGHIWRHRNELLHITIKGKLNMKTEDDQEYIPKG